MNRVNQDPAIPAQNPPAQSPVYPKIRPVEAIPLQDDAQEGICLRDPRQIAENILVLPPAFFLSFPCSTERTPCRISKKSLCGNTDN